MYRILIAEEDGEIRKTLVDILNHHGYKTIGVVNGEQALQMMEREYISLLLCNAMLAEIDGYELNRIIKERNYDIPVLMFMPHMDDNIRDLKFLDMAQDLFDYRDNEGILCRLQQMLQEHNSLEIEHITFGDVTVDLKDMYVQIEDSHFLLSKEEFMIIGKFMFFPNKIYTRLQLMEDITEIDGTVDEQYFEQYMQRIRNIISHSREVEIEHIQGLGYKAVKRKERKNG